MPSKRDRITESAIDLIGNTPLLVLDRLWTGKGRILTKCAFLNPGASVKDRAALAMIDSAIKSKQLKAGHSVVELTNSNLGSGLALVCAIRGLNLTLTMSEGNNPQRAEMMRSFDAFVSIVGGPGTYSGVSRFLKRMNDKIFRVAVESLVS
jgi:cysteine synthase A